MGASVGNNIRKYRKLKKTTQKELAAMLKDKFDVEIGQSAISQYEKGLISISYDMMLKIAEALEVSIFELLENDTFVKGLKDLVGLDGYVGDFDSFIRSKGIDPMKLNPWFTLSSRSVDDLDSDTMKSFLLLLFEEGKKLPSDYLREFYDRDMYVPEVLEDMIRSIEASYDFDLDDIPTWEKAREYLENLDFHLVLNQKTGKVEVLQNKAVVAVAFKSSLINAYVRIQKEVEKYSKYYALKTFEELDEREE